jgi:hypothetical protein
VGSNPTLSAIPTSPFVLRKYCHLATAVYRFSSLIWDGVQHEELAARLEHAESAGGRGSLSHSSSLPSKLLRIPLHRYKIVGLRPVLHTTVLIPSMLADRASQPAVAAVRSGISRPRAETRSMPHTLPPEMINA